MEYVEVSNIRVTNKETMYVFEHKKVPVDHVKLLSGHPYLYVEVLSTYRVSKEDVYSSSHTN
jgi:hypothetical protein